MKLNYSILRQGDSEFVFCALCDMTNLLPSKEELESFWAKSLKYVESVFKTKHGLPVGRRVWSSEYGIPRIRYEEETQYESTQRGINTGSRCAILGIRSPEKYNNELRKEPFVKAGYGLRENQNRWKGRLPSW